MNELIELMDELEKANTPADVPPCRICGGVLSPQAIQPGSYIFACTGRYQGYLSGGFKPGRSSIDRHYVESKVTIYRSDDARVLQLISMVRAYIEEVDRGHIKVMDAIKNFEERNTADENELWTAAFENNSTDVPVPLGPAYKLGCYWPSVP